jgi:hypothetical protein
MDVPLAVFGGNATFKMALYSSLAPNGLPYKLLAITSEVTISSQPGAATNVPLISPNTAQETGRFWVAIEPKWRCIIGEYKDKQLRDLRRNVPNHSGLWILPIKSNMQLDGWNAHAWRISLGFKTARKSLAGLGRSTIRSRREVPKSFGHWWPARRLTLLLQRNLQLANLSAVTSLPSLRAACHQLPPVGS